MIRAALFDFDGTIADTDSVHRACWNEVLQPHGASIDETFYSKHCSGAISSHAAMCILGAHPGVGAASVELADRKDSLYDSHIRSCVIPLMPGVKEILVSLKARDFRIGIVTGAPESAILKTLDDHLIADYFDVKVTRGDVNRAKPAPDGYLLALSQLGFSPDSSISFEDTESGVLAAKAAGMFSIAIPNEYTKTHSFKMSDHLCRDMFHAEEIIQKFIR